VPTCRGLGGHFGGRCAVLSASPQTPPQTADPSPIEGLTALGRMPSFFIQEARNGRTARAAMRSTRSAWPMSPSPSTSPRFSAPCGARKPSIREMPRPCGRSAPCRLPEGRVCPDPRRPGSGHVQSAGAAGVVVCAWSGVFVCRRPGRPGQSAGAKVTLGRHGIEGAETGVLPMTAEIVDAGCASDGLPVIGHGGADRGNGLDHRSGPLQLCAGSRATDHGKTSLRLSARS
jgi:hypothetical protein